MANRGTRSHAKIVCGEGGNGEYLRALRDRHNLMHKVSKIQPEGDVVIVKTENKNRGTWPYNSKQNLCGKRWNN